jgi:hypothetical protein
MKIQTLPTIIAALFLAIFAGPVCAQIPAYAIARSPDHPSTWVDGATRERQSLRWSPSKHMLFALVTYSTADFADGPHPTQEDDFSLALPTVHFDPASNHFLVDGTVIATLRHGIFGSSVALDPKLALSIHRHHGVVYAAIIPAPRDE